VLLRARYAALGAGIGAAIGGLFSRNAASTGGAIGGLVGATVADTRGTVDALLEDVKERDPRSDKTDAE
jgi:outer membrane lipoprotein SlyB